MKQRMPGFVPANYKITGMILLITGLACLIARSVAYFTDWFSLSNYLIYFGTVFILIGLYLIFVVPKE
ncbi:MAG: hypothetical protein V1838_03860 [Patescibacteria group bacterium]